MHFYQFHIGDYASHTQHLDPLEDIAYRRMIDWCYLNESPLPETVEEIARIIRMRDQCKCIAIVLQEYWTLTDEGYVQARIVRELDSYRDLSDKRKKAANKRWKKEPSKINASGDASALQVECTSNANHEPITNNHKPVNNRRFSPPTIQEVQEYVNTRDIKIDPARFIDHYEANGWVRGKTKIKDWKACVRTWEKSSYGRSEKQSAIETVYID